MSVIAEALPRYRTLRYRAFSWRLELGVAQKVTDFVFWNATSIKSSRSGYRREGGGVARTGVSSVALRLGNLFAEHSPA